MLRVFWWVLLAESSEKEREQLLVVEQESLMTDNKHGHQMWATCSLTWSPMEPALRGDNEAPRIISRLSLACFRLQRMGWGRECFPKELHNIILWCLLQVSCRSTWTEPLSCARHLRAHVFSVGLYSMMQKPDVIINNFDDKQTNQPVYALSPNGSERVLTCVWESERAQVKWLDGRWPQRTVCLEVVLSE